ncbi:MAG: right-handed parallel beta-helix repeat-containing protein [Flavitalea sp.]
MELGIKLSHNGIKIALLLFFKAGILSAQLYTIPGEIALPYPTLINLAIEWPIQGDDNQNGVVTVRFRKKGQLIWRAGMPLRRVPAGENKSSITLDRETPGFTGFTWSNKHSGSVFDLSPGTEYELLLKLDDPDGGSVEKMVVARTRTLPDYKKARLIDIKPGNYDTLHCKSGSRFRPLLYRCTKGKAVFRHIDMQNIQWSYVDGLEVRNKNKSGQAINLSGSENCAVSRCTINSVWGIVAYKPGSTNGYFSDNTVTGISAWSDQAMGAHGNNTGEGIEVTGPGNVICFNKVKNFRDCISTMEDEHAFNQVCTDIYNNDIYNAADDGVEADFCFSNCRITRNRLTNCYVGLSSQPGLGGPTYFIRNVMYNIVHAAFKLKRFSIGDIVLHNTVIKIGAGLGGNSAMDHAYFRNNLAFGGLAGEIKWGGFGAGTPSAADIIDPGKNSSFDYDAVGVYEIPYSARIGGLPFAEIEHHGIEQLSFDKTFNHVPFPYPPVPSRLPMDLRPRPGAATEDMAEIIPNVNDTFSGKAPDCGAYESGQALPVYGPRSGINAQRK